MLTVAYAGVGVGVGVAVGVGVGVGVDAGGVQLISISTPMFKYNVLVEKLS